MMGYSEESKSYLLFDLVKQHIIIRCNLIFDEKKYGLELFKSSFGSSQSVPFGIVEDIRLTIPPMHSSTSSSISILELTGSQSTPTETITSPDRSSTRDGTSPNPCLPRWVVKTIGVVGIDVGDISTGQQNHTHKQQASLALMNRFLDTCDPEYYADAQGKPKWEQEMKHEMDSLEKNHTWDLVPQPTEKIVIKC